KLGYGDAQVQSFGTSRNMLIRLALKPGLTSAQQSDQVIAGLKAQNADVQLQRVEFVGPQVGKELATDGLLALACVVIGIVIYLSFRFEWKYAVAGIIANLHDVVIILGFFAFFQWEFTVLVLTTGNGVNCFTLDRELGSWVLTQSNMQIPADTREYAINASNARHWYEPVKRYVDELNAGSEGPRGENFNMRWIASMVADVHRILNRGGIFMYPADARTPDRPGKLRLMYEANPMSFIVEQAG
ncbi:hypothetical protein PPH41_41345, partial [Burkholderia gladioli]|nr:hypothetical protein [Burkholderia gladioli]